MPRQPRSNSNRLLAFGALLVTLCTVLQAAASTTTLAITAKGSAVTTVTKGTAITLTATVTSASKPVSAGTVLFCNAAAKSCADINLIGTAELTSGGMAAFEFVPAPGAHTYKAVFIGTNISAKIPGSSSSAESLQVSGGPTATTLTQSGNVGDYTLTATVTGSSATVAPTGTVNFLDTTNSNSVVATASLGSAKTSPLTWTSSQTPGLGASSKNYPYSVAVGDFNDDGIPDLVFGSNGYISIILGNGDGTFQAAENYAALPNNQYIAVAKFINGGPDDVIVVSNSASTTANNFQEFLGNGKGGMTAQPAVNLGGLSSISGLAVGDLAYNGNHGFVVFGTTFGVYGFANVNGNGNGTFGGPTLNAVGGDAGIVVVGDFNNDGVPDIAVANDSLGLIAFQNNSQGFFSPAGNGTTPIANPTSAVVGDFNNDGNLDIALTDASTNTAQIFLGDGNFNFTLKSSPATGASPSSIAVGDFNGDGIADLAVTNSGSTGNTVTILLGKGDGTFTDAGTISAGTTPAAAAAGNFNGFATSSLAIASSGADTATVQLSHVTHTVTASATGVTVPGSGPQLVDASYLGDSTYAASVSSTASLTGSSTGTSTVIAASPNPAGVGQSVTLTATVTKNSGSGSPTGKVAFSVEGQAIGTGNLNSGVATLTASTNGLKPGRYPVVATYDGDSSDATSKSSALTVTLNAAATTTTLTASPTSVTPPAKVTLTATVVRSNKGSAGTPSGSVTFYADGSIALATVKLNSSGVASITASSKGYAAKTYPITAKYAGDSFDASSASTAVNVTVK